jgi:hypothetical protein
MYGELLAKIYANSKEGAEGWLNCYLVRFVGVKRK